MKTPCGEGRVGVSARSSSVHGHACRCAGGATNTHATPNNLTENRRPTAQNAQMEGALKVGERMFSHVPLEAETEG